MFTLDLVDPAGGAAGVGAWIAVMAKRRPFLAELRPKLVERPTIPEDGSPLRRRVGVRAGYLPDHAGYDREAVEATR